MNTQEAVCIQPLNWTGQLFDGWQIHQARVPRGIYYLERFHKPSDQWGTGENWNPWAGWTFGYYFTENDRHTETVASFEEGQKKAWHDWLSRSIERLKEENA